MSGRLSIPENILNFVNFWKNDEGIIVIVVLSRGLLGALFPV